MSLIDTITDEIKKAMLARDKVRLEALRAIKKELLEAKTAKGAGDELTEGATTALLRKMVKQRRESAEIYTAQKRDDLAGPEIAQMEVIREFLPEQLSPIELEAAVKRIIEKTGASSLKEMGKVMGIASKQLAGGAEGKDIAETVKRLLT